MTDTINVKIQKISINARKQQVYAIIGSDGEFFYDNRGEIRCYSVPAGAVTWLRRTAEKYGFEYQIEMPDETVKKVGVPSYSIDKYGPHEWSKKNLATIVDDFSTYDIYVCQHCKKEEKAYGLSGHLEKTGACPKNPL